jgi:3-phenylpropionate/trans-cinnamate dioxygenase ferredoxin component
MTEINFRRVASASQVAEGKMIEVDLDGKSIVLCRSRDGWHALDNICTHAYAKMHEGRLRGVRLICPLHGASFDCRTGAVLGAPAVMPLKTYVVRVNGDDVEIGV